MALLPVCATYKLCEIVGSCVHHGGREYFQSKIIKGCTSIFLLYTILARRSRRSFLAVLRTIYHLGGELASYGILYTNFVQ